MSLAILLIEDNEQNRYRATYLPAHQGYQMVSAFDGLRGIALAREMMPSIILLGIQLPMMGGYEVARALREIQTLTTTPIVAVTSYAMVGDREKALASGGNGYNEKPINPETFVQEIEYFSSVVS